MNEPESISEMAQNARDEFREGRTREFPGQEEAEEVIVDGSEMQRRGKAALERHFSPRWKGHPDRPGLWLHGVSKDAFVFVEGENGLWCPEVPTDDFREMWGPSRWYGPIPPDEELTGSKGFAVGRS